MRTQRNPRAPAAEPFHVTANCPVTRVGFFQCIALPPLGFLNRPHFLQVLLGSSRSLFYAQRLGEGVWYWHGN